VFVQQLCRKEKQRTWRESRRWRHREVKIAVAVRGRRVGAQHAAPHPG